MEISSQFNYYEILEVTPHSPQNEITLAYEKLRSTYSSSNPAIYSMFTEVEACELIQMVEEAYSVIGNKTLRTIYDEKLGQKNKLVDLSFEAIQVESKAAVLERPKTANLKSIQNFVPNAKFEAEYNAWTAWDGSKLTQIREYKKISAALMSEVTKVSVFYINAVESMDRTNLPAAVFVRGYVVQIAKTLGLNEKLVADSYMTAFKSALGKEK
jgi:curved DNA-binding protein CbpA